MKCTFVKWPCQVQFSRYDSTGNIHLQLVADDPDSLNKGMVHGEYIATATTNVQKLDDDRVAIKDSFENRGMVAALVHAGIIEAEPCGVVGDRRLASIHKLTEAALKEVFP